MLIYKNIAKRSHWGAGLHKGYFANYHYYKRGFIVFILSMTHNYWPNCFWVCFLFIYMILLTCLNIPSLFFKFSENNLSTQQGLKISSYKKLRWIFTIGNQKSHMVLILVSMKGAAQSCFLPKNCYLKVLGLVS